MTETRKFGLLFAGIFVLLAGYSLYRSGVAWPYFLGGSAFFLLTGLFAQPVLRPIESGWMAFAHALGWLNTRVLLGVFFYLVLTPFGLVRRILGKDSMDRRIDRGAKTYWVRRDQTPVEKSRYERLF